METTGVVRTWHDEAGWGVIDAPETPGGCWAHVSSVLVPGGQALTAGQSVTFRYEPGAQDGHRFRALEVWPAGREPDRSAREVSGPSEGYRSRLTLDLDPPGQ